MDPNPSWQSTVIGVMIIGVAAAIFLVVYTISGISDALKAWAAIGPLVALITGAIATYFFGRASLATIDRQREAAEALLDDERRERTKAENRAALLAGHVPPHVFAQLREDRRELFT
jgi:phosphotransferase system  glucose/maltose/N-acetylglucosamine-specific IIC component